MSLPQVAGCANTFPMRWACNARPRMDMWRCSVDWTMPPDLVVRQPLRHGSRTTGSIVEGADILSPDPDGYRVDDRRSTRRAADSGMGRRARATASTKRLFPTASGTRDRSREKPETRSRASTSRKTAVSIVSVVRVWRRGPAKRARRHYQGRTRRPPGGHDGSSSLP
jgi:hypothetical protein